MVTLSYFWDHILEGKACIKNSKTRGPSKWPYLTTGMSYSCGQSVSIELKPNKAQTKEVSRYVTERCWRKKPVCSWFTAKLRYVLIWAHMYTHIPKLLMADAASSLGWLHSEGRKNSLWVFWGKMVSGSQLLHNQTIWSWYLSVSLIDWFPSQLLLKPHGLLDRDLDFLIRTGCVFKS